MRKFIFAKTIMIAMTSILLFSQASFSSDKIQADNKAVEAEKDTQPLSQKEKLVNVNTATAKEIAKKLEGIGEAKANAIVAYRNSNGEFKKAEDLLKVKGIGKETLEKNRHLITL
jgi:competence protein ComEA